MKKSIILMILFFSSYSSYCQIDHIEILMIKTDMEVRDYLDSLNRLKYNSYFKIDKSFAANGDLILTCHFAMADQPYYKCTMIMTKFRRENGIEFCISQVILGEEQYAQSNLDFIKDNFTYVSSSNWVKPYAPNNPLKIDASFERKDGNYPVYVITYELDNTQ